MTTYFGIDVSKNSLEFAQAEAASTSCVTNDEAGIKLIVATIRRAQAPFVVVEATGGYEAAVVDALMRVGASVARINPRQGRAFAHALGLLAKTDKIDARTLARFGAAIQPRALMAADEQTKRLDELVRRRRDLVDIRSAEKTRQQTVSPTMRKTIQRHIDFLDEQVKELDDLIKQEVKLLDEVNPKAAIIRSMNGAGPVVTATLVAMMPELGTLSRRRIAALAGLAPYNSDSGQASNKRHIRGGREEVRSMLYMATLTAVQFNDRLRAFYERLITKGKEKKVAHIAAARKLLTWLNAMVRDSRPWDASLATV